MQAMKSTAPTCHGEDALPHLQKSDSIRYATNQQLFGLLGQFTQNRYIHMVFREANFFWCFVLCVFH